MNLTELMKKRGTDFFKIALLIISLVALLLATIALFRTPSKGGENSMVRSDFSAKKLAVNDLLENTGVELTGKEENLDLSNDDPEVGGIVQKVSKHILLPDRKFTVATVKDAEVLIKSSPILYRYVKNGQKMIIYDAGIIVYDEQLDKIVDVIQMYNVYEQKLITEQNSTVTKE